MNLNPTQIRVLKSIVRNENDEHAFAYLVKLPNYKYADAVELIAAIKFLSRVHNND